MCFNRSNADLFKTIKNENNLKSKVKNVYFIVSNNGNTFDVFLDNWKNKTMTPKYIFDEIIKLDNPDNAKVTHYKECKLFLENNSPDKINYLSKIIIEEGFTYDGLNAQISMLIRAIFNVNEDIVILYIKYYVFELFDKNWFKVKNTPLNITEIYAELKFKFGGTQSITNNIELFSYTFEQIINKMKQYLEVTSENRLLVHIENLSRELTEYVSQMHSWFEIKHYLCFLILLHRVNDIQVSQDIISIYTKLIKYLCRVLIKYVRALETISDEIIDKIIGSLCYYRSHKIDRSINLSSATFSVILSMDDRAFITALTAHA
jgi:hypothetical protein